MAAQKTFGTFFRGNRQAIGLTLREFCRRNGFDPGNVSRIERGLTPPPQTSQGLESYAKALRLEAGTDAWNTFYELAAAETGKIPNELLDNERSAKLPKLLRGLRGSRKPYDSWVKARHLEQWADSLDARATLPQLIRRLVWETGKDISGAEFPAGEQTQRPGWDGVVEAAKDSFYVPSGPSGWEMGVDKDPRTKAEGDFKTRTKNPSGLDKKKTTFVFVTPRKWQKKDDWIREKQELKAWKQVRVYDSATLEEWLERAPVADVWLARVLGLRPDELTDIDEYWENLQALTEPSLSPKVFLASREAEVKELEAWLEGPPGAMVIEARSPAEAIDFLVAFSRDPGRKDKLAARALIVETREAWRAVAGSADAGLLLIPNPSLAIEPEMVAEAVRQGHRVLLPGGPPPREGVTTLKLPRAYSQDLDKALEESGLVEEPKRQRCAREAGGSLTVLKRLLARYPGTTQPEWSLPENASALIPMLLAGSWDEGSEGDRMTLEKLSGRPYSDLSALAERWLKMPDSPLTRVSSRWKLVSRDDSWFLLASGITTDGLRRLERAALEVLAEDDPAYELPPEDRWQASLRAKTPKYSPSLRTGLSETLALLGARPEHVPDQSGLRGRVESIVRRLLERQTWLRWASLSRQLPILAEAGPEAFLAAAESDLKQADSALLKVFEQEGDSFFGSSPHTGLLWALEGLAWDRALLSRVSLVLAHLDERAPLGKLGNRPSRCLEEIFMPWFPQTTATVEERVQILKMLARKQPQAGWRLLHELLPNQLQTSTPTRRPLWRDWALGWNGGVTNAEYWYQASACARLLVENLGDDVGRWTEIIGTFENLPDAAQKEFVGRLNSVVVTSLSQASRRAVTEALREKVSTHRRFFDTDWAMPSETLSVLKDLLRRFEPEDCVARNAWLFGPRWSVVERLKSDDEEQNVDEARRVALVEIEGQAGWAGIQRLIEASDAPSEVGAAVGELVLQDGDRRVLPAFLVSDEEKSREFAFGYVFGRHKRGGWEWVESLETAEWTAEEHARLLMNLPFERKAWEMAAFKGTEVEAFYWGNTRAFFRSCDADEVVFSVTTLIKHERPSAAFDILRMAIHDKLEISPQLLMDALDLWNRPGAEDKEPSPRRIDRHEIHLLFQQLQKGLQSGDPRVDRDRLGSLEWRYLGILDGHPTSPATLHTMLRDNPGFFVEVLGLVFPGTHVQEEPGKEPSEQDRLRFKFGYRLLTSWREAPGSREGGEIDEKAMLDWVKKARALAEERGLLEVCDSRIGQVLAHAIGESDGSGAASPVWDLLEEIGSESDEIFSGFSVGIYNKRGMVTKSLREGGEQERGLAQRYRQLSEILTVDWPKSAATLRQIAQGYEEEARRADNEPLLD